MIKLNEATIEEFRIICNFQIDQMIAMLKISESSYEGIKEEPIVCYSYRPEIKEIFIENVEKEIKAVCERYRIEFAEEMVGILSEVMQMNKGNLASVLWKTLVMGETTRDENKKQEIFNIEQQIISKKNDC